jgi:ribA/ribD-fused uncharacterized protein
MAETFETKAIFDFTGPYRFLSNFHPVTVVFEGKQYPSVEHAYQAAKTLDPDERVKFQDPTLTAAGAKKLGRRVALREDWDTDTKLFVMRKLLAEKFAPGTVLGEHLMGTYPAFIAEGNWWGDTFWGICRGDGENWLGQLLMARRQELRGEGDQ